MISSQQQQQQHAAQYQKRHCTGEFTATSVRNAERPCRHILCIVYCTFFCHFLALLAVENLLCFENVSLVFVALLAVEIPSSFENVIVAFCVTLFGVKIRTSFLSRMLLRTRYKMINIYMRPTNAKGWPDRSVTQPSRPKKIVYLNLFAEENETLLVGKT